MDPRLAFLVLCLVTGALTEAVTEAPAESPSSFEKFFDAVIKGILKKKYDILEPYHIEDLDITIRPDVRSYKLPAQLHIHASNNTLWGGSTIHRSGHATVKMQLDSRFTKAQLAAGALHATSNLTVSVWGLKLRPTVEIDISNFDFIIEIFGNKTVRELKTVTFKVTEMKDLKVTLKQWKWTDPIGNRIIKQILPHLEEKIRTEVEDTLKGHLDDKLKILPDELKQLFYG